MPVSGSTVVRRQLGRKLRALREEAGKTIAEVEAARLGSATKLWRIESGKTAVRYADVLALCRFYGADAVTEGALLNLATGTTQRGWWEDYRDVIPADFGLYIGLEAVADQFRLYEAELVPGIFQTRDYAHVIFTLGLPLRTEEEVDRLIALRMDRQATVLDRRPPRRIHAVLNAAVLSRPVGGPAVMREQIERLRALARLAHIDIQVLPWEVGAHAAMVGSFYLLDFDDPDDPAVVFADTHIGSRYDEEPARLNHYREVFELVYQQAIQLEEYLE